MIEQKDVQRCREIAVKKVSTSNELYSVSEVNFTGQKSRSRFFFGATYIKNRHPLPASCACQIAQQKESQRP
jgi:hypothetical protein